MRPIVLLGLAALSCAVPGLSQDAAVLYSDHAAADFPLTADPASPAWAAIAPVFMDRNPIGQPVPGHRTEIRSRWTGQALYFLFVCPYEKLSPNPSPNPAAENRTLWKWDNMEFFLGADFTNLWHFAEISISPQEEWYDLLRGKPEEAGGGFRWSSGLKVKARVDSERKVWFGEIMVPFASFDRRKPQPGNRLRVNFIRGQGPLPDTVYVAWQPTGTMNDFPLPKVFGTLVLR